MAKTESMMNFIPNNLIFIELNFPNHIVRTISAFEVILVLTH